MLPFNIIPKGRGKKDKQLYLFWRYWMKQHRKEIEKKIREMTFNLLVYGEHRRRIFSQAQSKTQYAKLSPHFKIMWAKSWLSPGLRKLTYQIDSTFDSKEWIKFFDWAQTDKYDMIIKYVKLRRRHGRI